MALASAAMVATASAWPRPAFAQVGDLDNDGLSDLTDPCPADPRNFCFGPLAVDQATQLPLRINAGLKRNVECSGVRVDCSGLTWNRDLGFNQAGKTGVCDLNGGAEACVITGITELFGCEDENTEDIFQCEHFDRPLEPELTYTFTVENGQYLVNLFFANTFEGTTAPGTRLFDVAIEGTTVLDDFDQVVAAGGSAIAVVRSALVTVSDGILNIDFVHVLENPSVKAIEVLHHIDCLTDPDCVDTDLCNGAETCSALHCIDGPPVVCQPNQVCDPPTGNCLAPGGPCTTNADCIGGELCNTTSGLCQPLGGACDDDTDCVGGEACNTVTGVCQEPGGSCEDEKDCVASEGCNINSGLCQPFDGPCTTNADCVSSQVCNLGGNCEGAPPTTTTVPGSTTTTVPGQCAPACDSVCERCDTGTCTNLCGNPFQPETSETTASDALFALRTATGLQTCPLCLCDAINDGDVKASDALAILRFATGLPVTLACPGPGSTTSTTSTTTTGPTTTTTTGQTTTTVAQTTTTGGPTTTSTAAPTTTTGGSVTTTTAAQTTTTAGPTTTTTVAQTTTTAGPTTTTTVAQTTTTAGPTTTTTTVSATTTTTSGSTTTTTT